MPSFAYTGRTRSGEVVSGERAADSMENAVAALRREQLIVTRITPAKAKAAAGQVKVVRSNKKVKAKNLAIFTRQFSVMIDAGLPLVQCLEILGSQEEDKNFAAVIMQTRSDVESGAALADAMKKHPGTFDALYTNMVAAGEAGGILDAILKRLAVYIEKNVKLVSQVKSAMTYPVAVISIAAIVVMVILWKVIPTFASLFAGLGAELPLPTRIVIWMSDAVVKLMPFIVIGVIAGVYGIRQYYATNNGRHTIDRMLLRAPALYADDCFDSGLAQRRPGDATSASTPLAHLALFRGAVTVVESEHDEVISRATIEAYLAARPGADHVIQPGARHALTEPAWRADFLRVVLEFFADL